MATQISQRFADGTRFDVVITARLRTTATQKYEPFVQAPERWGAHQARRFEGSMGRIK
jgi:hypothetical protein